MIISVAGEHQIRLAPELATVHLAVEVEGDEAGTVVAEAEDTTRDLLQRLAQLREAGAVERWTLEALTTTSWQAWGEQGRPGALRHRAQQLAEVVFTDFTALPTETSAWAAREGMVVRGVDWDVTEDTRRRHEAQVLAAAVEQAAERATVMARAAGRRQVDFLEIADPGLLSQPLAEQGVMMARMAKDGEEHTVQLSPAPVLLSARVQARFEA
ncbi:SIMPL domain-containing protein [Luteococcus peritonei]|uniref:SIMPL domain-containing protein n=1 Tax=Luteococcus peritonei TaxID=88874 RepID=A0ABW4RZB1_9ACTN